MRIVTGLIMDVATKNSRYVRVVESTRASQRQTFEPDVGRAVRVSASCMAARFANKTIPCLSICFFRVAALAALAGRIVGVNPQKRNSGNLCLVIEHPAQFGKRPTMQLCPLALSSPDPRSYAGQFLDGNHSICAFGERDYASRNCMVRVFCKPLLLAAAFLQKSASRFCADALQLAAQGAIAVTNLVKFCAAIFVSIRVRANVHDSHVQSQNFHRLNLFFFRHVHRHIQKPFAIAKDQIRFTLRKIKQIALAFAADKRQSVDSISNCPNAHGGFWQLKTQNTGIVGNAAMLAELALNFAIEFIGISHLRIETDNDLRRQRKLIPNLPVKEAVHRKLAELFLFPSQFRQAIGGAIGRFQRHAQARRLLRRRQKFHLHRQLHAVNIFKDLSMSTDLRRNNHSVSRLLVHFVFVVKYRRAVISEKVWASLSYGFGLAATRLDLELVETNHDQNHVHMVVEYPPKTSVSEVANALKGNSSFVARRDCKEELLGKLWGSAFWTPSFFACSCGGAPIEILKLYVQSQQTKGVLKDAVSTHKL